MSLILTLIIIGVIFYFIDLIPMASPMPQIIKAVMIILAIVLILNALGVTGIPTLR